MKKATVNDDMCCSCTLTQSLFELVTIRSDSHLQSQSGDSDFRVDLSILFQVQVSAPSSFHCEHVKRSAIVFL
jgi:hypothetical protein